MIWEEVLISKKAADIDVSSITAKIFSIDMQSISVVKSISDQDVDNSKLIIVESSYLEGDFLNKLTFYITEEEIPVGAINKFDSIAFLCRTLDCRALISDEDVNPYSMNLVDTDGSVKKIFLDVDKLDNKGQFIISRVA